MKKFIIALSLLSLPLAAQESPNWNFMQISYMQADVDVDVFDKSIKPVGFGITGSTLIGENVILMASYGNLSDDDVFGTEVDLDFNLVSAGIGYRFAATNSTDIFGIVSYVYAELEYAGGGLDGSEDDSGYGLTFGVRSMLTESFEVVGSLGYIDIDDESETALGVSAYYHINQQFVIGAGYSVADDVDMLSASLSLSF